MHASEDFFLIGTLSKTHGVSGEFLLVLNDLHPDTISEMESVFIEFDGLLVPFFVSGVTARNATSVLVKFDSIESEDHASEFVHCKVYSQEVITRDDDDVRMTFQTLHGYAVVDKHMGDIGNIDKFLDLPDNPLLRIMFKKREIFLPLQEEFIERIDHEKKILFIHAPEGLIDIYKGEE